MTRRVLLLFLILVLCAASAWPKFKEDEQRYLDEQFKVLQDQIQALTTELQRVNAQLADLRQNQAQFQAVTIRQQRALQELWDMASSTRVGNEDGFSNLKTAISELRNETQAGFKEVTGRERPKEPTEIATGPRVIPQPVQPTQIRGYITTVEGNNVMVDIGSAQGLQPGSRLAVYKANDPNTRVGVVEVIQVLDAGNSRARIVTMNPGVRPDFSDVVRLE